MADDSFKELETVEDQLAMLTTEDNKIFSYFSTMSNTDGSCNINGT